MSSYKSAIRAQPPSDSPVETSKFREKARQLQELFPSWSNDDLQSLLAEVNGDVETAATRISDGHAEQWGAVTRKKEKKPTTPSGHAAKESISNRGDFRGGRGGRSGRGGPGRGGPAVRGRGGPPRGGANGHAVNSSPRASPVPSGNVWANGAPSTSAPQPDASASSNESTAWDSSSHLDTSTAASTPGSAWTGVSTASTWGGDTEASVSSVNLSPKPTKTPATSKMSWAQIARPQEKPTPPPAPVVAPPAPAPAVAPPPIQPPAPAVQEPDAGWEEPTTHKEPTWDDEPPKTSAADVWPAAEPISSEAEPPAPAREPTPPPPPPEPISEKVAEPSPAPSPAVAKAAAAPIRPAVVAHRNSAKYKTDQPVVMPSSSFGTGLDKVGMQFGSLSLGGETMFEPSEPEPQAEQPPSPPTPQPSLPVVEPVAPAPAPPVPAVVSAPQPSVTSTSLGSSLYQQQQQQSISHPQQPQASPLVATTHANLPTSVSQPAVPTQPPHLSNVAASPRQQYTQQPPHLTQQPQQHQTHHQAPQSHLPQQLQQQSLHHHQYSQHGLPTHIESQQTQTPPQQQPSSAHSSYFRGGDVPPYFHAPTPPAQEQGYNSFGQLVNQNQPQPQQPSHLGGFSANDYGGYTEGRGFYENYQPTGFGGRHVLGSHEDIKGLPGNQSQPPSSAGGLPPSNSGGSQQQQQPSQPGQNQGPQGYPAPPPTMPYYYNPYTQNQYYGSPYNSAYGVPPPQPFVKYATMYQPPGPGGAPSPVTKQPGNAQQGYGQGFAGGYEEYQHQGLGGGADYGKPLYGGGAGARGSPETPYKPYATGPKDVNVGGQAKPGQAQPQQQGFYGNRFASGGGAGGQGVGGPQQTGHGPQGHLYPQQGQNDASFYYQNQGGRYWQ